MIMNEETSTYPEEVVACVLPEGGTDIWIRKDITEVDNSQEESGKTYISTSAYMRIPNSVTKENVVNNLSYYWEMAKNWEPMNNYTGVDENTKKYIDSKINEMFSTVMMMYQGGSI